ncbi:exported hypothetical protein [uncultured Eubacteriales bacterium]|uniref:SLH domain-containing protein n=1 Tax=uncultured Eubacteriales bacterium TaxID=172733 RepID=A0A212JPN4_9FIRM|nr:exported hypothetical protein [uncultured Eubacteriales bacterium]
MQRVSKRALPWILALVLVFSMSPAVSAAGLTPRNEGVRHEDCTSLSAQADSYYTGDYAWDKLSTLEGTDTDSSLQGTKTPLYSQLQTLMSTTMTKKVTYNSLTSYWPTTDTQPGYSNATLFYCDVDSSSYNREHVWPKSRASYYETGGGADLHHLRPTNSTVNSTRNNYTMGNVQGVITNPSTYSYGGKIVLWYNTAGNGLVEVNDDIKGDVARILLYIYVRWGQPNLFEQVAQKDLPPLDSDDDADDGKPVIESLDTLLQWCENDPVDNWEMQRNDLCQGVQGNRNVFIDYPELAWLLFNKTLPADMKTPSGGSVPTDPAYTVTPHSNNDAWGDVTISGGRITAAPKDGYYTEGFTVEPANAATVTQSGNVFTVKDTKENCTVTIQFAPKTPASVSYIVPEGVSVTNGPAAGYLGDSITLPTINGAPTDNSKDYSFVGWVEDEVAATKSRDGFTVLATGASYTLKNVKTMLYALYSYRVEDGSGAADTFELVTTKPVSGDWSGDYVMTNPSGDTLHLATGKEIDTQDSAVSLATSGVTKAGNTLSGVTSDYVIAISKLANGNYTLRLKGAPTDTYLTFPGGSKNAIGTTTNSNDAIAQWTLALSGGNMVITNVGNTSYQLKWNNSWKGFRCYTTGQENVKLYAAAGAPASTYYLTLGEGTDPDPEPIPANIGYAVPKGVTVPGGPTTGEVGKPIVLPSVSGTPEDNSKDYTFVGWVDKKIPETTSSTGLNILNAGTSYTITKQAVELFALYSYKTESGTGGEDSFSLVTAASELKTGDMVVIVSKNVNYALGTTQNNNNRKAAEVTKSGETVEIGASVAELTLETGNIPDTFSFNVGSGYLYAAGKLSGDQTVKGNWLRTESSISDNSSWKIEIAADGNATVKAQGANDANWMRYNPNVDQDGNPLAAGPLFGCYGPNSSMKDAASDIAVYKKGSGGSVITTYYLTLAEGGGVENPDPVKLPVPVPSKSGGEVTSGDKVTFTALSGATVKYVTVDPAAGTPDWRDVPAEGLSIEGTSGATVKIWVKSTRADAKDSDVVALTFTIKKADSNPGPSSGTNTGGTAANPVVKAEDVKVNDGTAEIKLPAANAKLDDAANKKAASANGTKPVAITGGGLNIIIPAGTLTAGTDVNALLVDPKAAGSVIRVTRSDGTTAILPIATVSGGNAAYVVNILGKYEVVDNDNTFRDTDNHWALPAIGFVSAREIFRGDSTGAFRPDQPMTRGMLATVLARIDGGKTGAGTPFADVPAGSWYAGEIAWAAQNKLVEGDGKNFNPDDDLTREQLCVILIRYLNYSGLTLAEATAMGDFSDLSKVSPWAKDAVEQAVKAGLIDGKTGVLIDPQGKATRAEIATILQRFVEGVLK